MQTANCDYLQIHPSELITVQGNTPAGRTLEIYLLPWTVNMLRKVFAIEPVTGHLGHAYWHIKSETPAPCPSCHPYGTDEGA